jgi:hypothetical protein
MEAKMSANVAFTQLHYEESMTRTGAGRAGLVAAVLSWVVDVFTQPLSPEIDLGPAPRSRDFPAFYC